MTTNQDAKNMQYSENVTDDSLTLGIGGNAETLPRNLNLNEFDEVQHKRQLDSTKNIFENNIKYSKNDQGLENIYQSNKSFEKCVRVRYAPCANKSIKEIPDLSCSGSRDEYEETDNNEINRLTKNNELQHSAKNGNSYEQRNQLETVDKSTHLPECSDEESSQSSEESDISSLLSKVSANKPSPAQTSESPVCYSSIYGSNTETTQTEHVDSTINKNVKFTESFADMLKRAREFSRKRIGSGDIPENPNPLDCNKTEFQSHSSDLNNCNQSERVATNEDGLQQYCALEDGASTLRSPSAMDCSTPAPYSGGYNLSSPTMVLDYKLQFTGLDNFTKGCHWSPDGERLLVLSSDQKFRLFDLPEQLRSYTAPEPLAELNVDCHPSLTVTEGELVYDYAWYPLQAAQDPTTCNFVCCARGLPIHMWHSESGELVCSYRPFNHLDELAPAYSVGFSRDGSKLVCGFNKIIRVFATSRPGRQSTAMCAKRQNGIISCFDFHPFLHDVVAAGSYLGTVGLYNTATNKLFSLLEGHTGGITQLCFSSDGLRLYTGARKDGELLCWDVRRLGDVLYSHRRVVATQQRIGFSLAADDRTLVTGSTDGLVSSWDVSGSDPTEPLATSFRAHDDCVNGISLHPHYPVLATSSGQRRWQADEPLPPSTARLWWVGK